jgi:signal transduction histidine kinase
VQLEGDSQVLLTYADDGKGIAASIRGRIFDPFFTTDRAAGGTGLGLNIVHNLVVGRLGGRIALGSAVGTGTTFTISIPTTAPTRSVRTPEAAGGVT